MNIPVDAMYHMSESGLDNLYLINGFRVHETRYGRGHSFENKDALLRAAAIVRAKSAAPLTGREMKFLRLEAGLTQEALADLLELSSQTIAKWEKKEGELVHRRDAMVVRAHVLSKLAPGEVAGTEWNGQLERIEMEYSPVFGWRQRGVFNITITFAASGVEYLSARALNEAACTYQALVWPTFPQDKVTAANDETYSLWSGYESERAAA